MSSTSPALPGTADPAPLLPGNNEMAWEILKSITDAFQVFDADWRLSYMNPKARKLFAAHDVDPDAMIGKRFFVDLFPDVSGIFGRT